MYNFHLATSPGSNLINFTNIRKPLWPKILTVLSIKLVFRLTMIFFSFIVNKSNTD